VKLLSLGTVLTFLYFRIKTFRKEYELETEEEEVEGEQPSERREDIKK
jgi:hypothetical protein